MDLLQTITKSLWSEGMASIAGMIGQDNDKANDTVNTALGFLFQGLGNNASDPTQAQAIADAAEKHDSSILSQATSMLADGKIDTQDGLNIIKHVFGNKTTQVEETIAQNTGLSTEKTESLLSTLAPLVMSGLNPSKSSDGGIDLMGMASSLLGAGKSANDNSSVAMNIMTGLLDKDGDGSITDDLINTATSKGGNIVKNIIGKMIG